MNSLGGTKRYAPIYPIYNHLGYAMTPITTRCTQ